MRGEDPYSFIRSLRNEPSLTLTLPYIDEQHVKWMKAFLEGALGKNQKRMASLMASKSQVQEPGVANVLASGVRWIEV